VISLHSASEKNLLNTEFWKKETHVSWHNSFDDSAIMGCADPFLIKDLNNIYLFYEVEIGTPVKGVLWCSKLEGNTFGKPTKILEKEYHLSFPNVFLGENGEYLMIPESYENNTVDLYFAKKFPSNWEFDTTLFKGGAFVDTVFHVIDGVYYWFTYDLNVNRTRLFYSKSLRGSWTEHPNSFFNSNRNAGRIFFHEGKVIRPIQVSYESYGEGVQLMEITELSLTVFKEKLFKYRFLFKNKGFELHGIHHFTFIENNEDVLIVTDGLNINFYKSIE
jgi:hypothetical protein